VSEDITFSCPHCAQHLDAPLDMAGSQVACPSCSQAITIPSSAPAPALPQQGTTPPASSGAISLQCDKCGGQLEYSNTSDIARCPFCGNANVITRPADTADALRDLEQLSLAIHHLQPSLSPDDVREIVYSRIEADESGLRHARSLDIHIEQVFFPAWKVDVSAQCSWNGENSREEPFTNYRTEYDQVGDRTIERKVPYTDYRTVWDPVNGVEVFDTSVILPAAPGISAPQFEMTSKVPDDHASLRSGAPSALGEYAITKPSKSQNESWTEFDGDSSVESHAWVCCMGLAEQINHVSSSVLSRNFSIIYYPLAVATYTANGVEYRHFVNLQTGDLSGDFPLDYTKVANEASKARQEKKEVNLARIAATTILVVYIATTALICLSWHSFDFVQALISGFLQPFSIFRDNLGPHDLLAQSHFYSFTFSWAAWLILFIIYKVTIPSFDYNPWHNFLAKRQAFFLRLLLNPTSGLASQLAAAHGSQLEDFQKTLKKSADENTLEQLPLDATINITEPLAKDLLQRDAKVIPSWTSSFIGLIVGLGIVTIASLWIMLAYSGQLRTLERKHRWAIVQEQQKQEEERQKEEKRRKEQKRKERLAQQQQERADGYYQRGLAIVSKENVSDESYRTAFQSFEKAAKLDHPLAMYQLGMMTQDGAGVQQSHSQAVTWYRKAAEAGEPKAMSALGFMYLKGQGVRQDYSEAATLFERAGEQGNGNAFHNLAHMYREGLGVSKSEYTAEAFYEKAAELGYEASIHNLAHLYYAKGSYYKAATWVEKSAKLGDHWGMYMLAAMYYNGNGLSRDHGKALQWFQKAATAGNVEAVTDLGIISCESARTQEDYAAASRLLKSAADAGNTRAMQQIGYMYENGYGVRQNTTEARRWYNKARGTSGSSQRTRRVKIPNDPFWDLRDADGRVQPKKKIYWTE